MDLPAVRTAGLGAGLLLLLTATGPGAQADAAAADPVVATGTRPEVLLVPIEGIIDLGLAPLVERALQSAAAGRAALVILEINTFGGRVDAAVAIRDHLLRSKVRTVAFINKRAISAGALIALAAHQIVVADGATMGAATPVHLSPGGDSTRPTDEKTVSYMRKEFRSTADARGRPGAVAEAMVDADVEIPGLVAKGKLLTLTGAEALSHKMADHQADDVAALLTRLGLTGAMVRPVNPNWAERLVRALTHPIISSLLMTLGMLGLVVELRTPGFGIPGAIGVICLVSFFWGHWLVRLVGWEEILLVTVGVLLLALELFVLPGFGLAGTLGVMALLAGLTSSLLGSGATLKMFLYAGSRVAISAALALMGSLLLLRFLPALPGARRLVLRSALPGGGSLPSGEPSAQGSSGLRGVVGTALTPLRPAGIALLAGRRVDVVSTGEYVLPGSAVEVVEDAGSRVVVRLHPSAAPGQPEPGATT
jgi:membrane-bound serine protease (ClpP class)